ncbi:hypothetical protein ACFVH6_25530 [Spirillospora sp. NPDC127200]
MPVSLIKTYSNRCEGDLGDCPRTATRLITYAHNFIHECDDSGEKWLTDEELCSSCARWIYPGERVYRKERPESVYTISVLSVELLSTEPEPIPA